MSAIEHLSTCRYDNKIMIDNLTIMIKPLNYRTVTDFNLRNFELRRHLAQLTVVESEEDRKKIVSEIYEKLAVIQTDSYIASIDSVQAPEGVVDERQYIVEWIMNSEKSIFQLIKDQIEKNNKTWRIPDSHVKCTECGHEADVGVEIDQTNFFVNA
jgi:hypothetical protein